MVDKEEVIAWLREWWGGVLFFCAIVCCLLLILLDLQRAEKLRDAANAKRTSYCGLLCEDSDGMYQITREKVGWGSYETNCYCNDGESIKIP